MRKHQGCADASQTLGDALCTEVQVVGGGGSECRMGSSGLENTDELSELGKSLCTKSLSSSADSSSQLSLSLEHSNCTSQSTVPKQAENGFVQLDSAL